jgi:hypothetical protein
MQLAAAWRADVGWPAGRRARHRPAVTEPPKIIPYYRLSLSTWPLSNNKELFCRFCHSWYQTNGFGLDRVALCWFKLLNVPSACREWDR